MKSRSMCIWIPVAAHTTMEEVVQRKGFLMKVPSARKPETCATKKHVDGTTKSDQATSISQTRSINGRDSEKTGE